MKAYNPNTSQWEDIYVKALDSFPVGVIVEYPTTDSAKLPTGYMFCDGSAISRTEYSELFSLIGTSFGAGDGSTTFNIPSKKGLVTVGINSSDTAFNVIGKTGGSKYLQAHKHTLTGGSGNLYYTSGSSSTWTISSTETGYKWYTDTDIKDNAGNNLTTGGSGNLQPYEVSNFIIKVKHTRALAGTVVNDYSESTENAYSSDYCNKAFGGKVLWTNPSPGNSITTLNIELNSDDYDILELYYLQDASSSGTSQMMYDKIIKGNSFRIMTSVSTGDANRSILRTDDIHYTIGPIGGTATNVTASNLIPMYIIGYKTGLFS